MFDVEGGAEKNVVWRQLLFVGSPCPECCMLDRYRFKRRTVLIEDDSPEHGWHAGGQVLMPGGRVQTEGWGCAQRGRGDLCFCSNSVAFFEVDSEASRKPVCYISGICEERSCAEKDEEDSCSWVFPEKPIHEGRTTIS